MRPSTKWKLVTAASRHSQLAGIVHVAAILGVEAGDVDRQLVRGEEGLPALGHGRLSVLPSEQSLGPRWLQTASAVIIVV